MSEEVFKKITMQTRGSQRNERESGERVQKVIDIFREWMQTGATTC